MHDPDRPDRPDRPAGRLLFTVLAMVAEFEAALAGARTREGMAVARAKGRLRGKSPKLTARQEAHLGDLHWSGGHTVSELEELFGGGPVDGVPGGAPRRLGPLARRHRRVIAAVQNGAVIRLPIDVLFRAPLKVAEAVGLSRSSRNAAPASVAPDEPPTEKDEQTLAQKTTVQLVDDLDGSEAEETVSFALDGTSYEIDLSGEHANALREALAPYVVAARKAGGSAANGRRGGGRRGSGAGSGAGSNRERTAQIRQWAREQGLEVNERGPDPEQGGAGLRGRVLTG